MILAKQLLRGFTLFFSISILAYFIFISPPKIGPNGEDIIAYCKKKSVGEVGKTGIGTIGEKGYGSLFDTFQAKQNEELFKTAYDDCLSFSKVDYSRFLIYCAFMTLAVVGVLFISR